MATATVTAPIRETQINQTLFVGEAGIRTIQAAVHYANKTFGIYSIVIPANYAGSDTIAAVTEGNANLFITDERGGKGPQNYAWNGANFVPAEFIQLGPARFPGGIGGPLSIAGDVTLTGNQEVTEHLTVGAGLTVIGGQDITGDQLVQGNQTITGDATIDGLLIGKKKVRGYGFAPIDLTASYVSIGTGVDGTTSDITLVNATAPVDQKIWLVGAAIDKLYFTSSDDAGGDYYWMVAHRSGHDVTQLEIYPPLLLDSTLNVTGDATVEGDVEAANLRVSGDAILGGDLEAQRADFTSCFVNGSAVLTVANLPPAGIPYPPAGIGVSTGAAWAASINATNPTFAGTVTAAKKVKAYGFVPLDLAASHVSIGTGVDNTTPDILLCNTSAPADQKLWFIGANANATSQLFFSMTSDAAQDHAWMIADRVGTVCAAVQFIGNAGAVGGMTATPYGAGALALAHNVSNGGGESVFVNVKPSGSTGGFAWYNVDQGTLVDGTTTATMKLDGAGNVTVSGYMNVNEVLNVLGNGPSPDGALHLASLGGSAFIDANGVDANRGTLTFRQFAVGESSGINLLQFNNEGNALFTGSVALGSNFGEAGGITVPVPPLQSLLMGWNLSNGGGETDFINSNGNAGGGFNFYSAVPGAHLGPGDVPLLNINGTGDATFKGFVRLGSTLAIGAAGGVQTQITPNASTTFFDCYGADPATNGLLQVRSLRSDGSNLINALIVDGEGAPHFANTIYCAGVGVGLVYPLPTNPFQIYTDGGSTFMDGGCGYRLVINHGSGGAGYCEVDGTLTVFGTKTFACAHPLIKDKDLIHACLEGPENGVFYRGEVMVEDGSAEITLPDYFEALTFREDRSVLLTQIMGDDSGFAMLAASRIENGKFRIRSSVKSALVAWEVKAVRRIGVERLAVVRDRFIHKKEETTHGKRQSRAN
jgi:hypothetical protein